MSSIVSQFANTMIDQFRVFIAGVAVDDYTRHQATRSQTNFLLAGRPIGSYLAANQTQRGVQMGDIIAELRQALPPIFAGRSADALTGNAIRWRTIQNKRSRREIPDDCFIYSGRQVLVKRDPFLDWWGSRLTTEGPQRGRPVAPRRNRRSGAPKPTAAT